MINDYETPRLQKPVGPEDHAAGSDDAPVTLVEYGDSECPFCGQAHQIIKQIMDVADHPNVGVCWNCNGPDLEGEGLRHNFNLVKGRFGATAHVRELNIGSYPYQELIGLLVDMDYDGWILLECRTNPKDRVAALIEQRKVFEDMVAKAQA